MKSIVLAVSIVCAAAVPALAQDAGWIGISIEDQKDGGPVIRQVEPNSPAEKAGLKQGDIVVEYNREQVAGVQQLSRLVRETPVGRTVDVKVSRGGREQTVQVTTDRGPGPAYGNLQLKLPNVHILADQLGRNFPRVLVNTVYIQQGIHIEQLTDQLRNFFGVYTNNGVLVTSVDSGSAAEKAGLKAGDVIIAVDGKNIGNPVDFNREMRETATLKIIRDKQEMEIRL